MDHFDSDRTCRRAREEARPASPACPRRPAHPCRPGASPAAATEQRTAAVHSTLAPQVDERGRRSGIEAVETSRRWRPDIVFLDVQTPECDGFDVLELLGGDAPAALVFVTAYDQHALRAFDAGALDC